MLCINTVQQRDETQQVGTDSINILVPNNCHNLPPIISVKIRYYYMIPL